jgi:Fur family transcriptional regulator, peroxide stress response regulator
MPKSKGSGQSSLKDLKAAAKEAGLKLTRQRLEIFAEISSRLDHPDAEAIYASLKPRMPSISLDTVYRTLWTLADLGLIGTLGPRQERQRFDGNLERHHHFVCLRCGKTVDFTSAEFDSLKMPSGLSAFGKVVSSQVEVRGYCSECSREAGSASDP